MQDDWNAPEYMNWEHEKPRNGPFVGLAKVSIDMMSLESYTLVRRNLGLQKIKNFGKFCDFL